MADIILFLIYVKSMPEVVEILFWACFFIIFYTYAGYPLLLFLVVKIKKLLFKTPVFLSPGLLPVTLIVTAHNEEKIIEEKINNCFRLDYPDNLLNLVFITDGSSDLTPDIVKRNKKIILLHEPVRKGKLAAMNRAIKYVTTPIVVFSDANTFLNRDSIKYIVSHYADPEVGGIAGEKRILGAEDKNTVSQGEGLYWRYESLLKKLDSELKTTVGAAGELFSIRTSLYTILPENIIIEDFVQSLLLCVHGYTVKYEPRAYSTEKASLSFQDEMERKVRISAGAFQAMGKLKTLFNVFHYPIISFQFISHRILRWTLCPIALVLLFISSTILYFSTKSGFWGTMILLQLAFYIAAAIGGYIVLKGKHIKVLYLPFYFVFMNFCVFAGFFRFLKNGQTSVWERAERAGAKI